MEGGTPAVGPLAPVTVGTKSCRRMAWKTSTAWPGWAQTVIYVILGVVWLLPLGRFLIWMETGSWSHPDKK